MQKPTSPPCVIIGAGIGGLAAAAVLARAGLDVTVLEAHVYPGGCAGTFFHQGYRFDAGATLAGGFHPGGPMDLLAQAAGIRHWPVQPTDPAMIVHLPWAEPFPRWTDARRWQARREAFGPDSEAFFRWQEKTADALWALALRNPAWPPQTLEDAGNLLQNGLAWLVEDPAGRLSPAMWADAVRPVSTHLKRAPDSLRLFVDGQLLISAQTTSPFANALYGAAALDLPRRGVVHVNGGMGGIANALVQAIRTNGGQVLFRKTVQKILMRNGMPEAVQTRRGELFHASIVIANLPPWNLTKLFGDTVPRKLSNLPAKPADGWGAFTVYAGVDASALPPDFPLHHQVIIKEPLSEGNSIFMSLSPAWDPDRGPRGKRALTISTHTRLGPWWKLFETDRTAYERRKEMALQRVLSAGKIVIPNLQEAADLILPGTPVTFQRFTHRERGWVGGFPQTSLLRTWGPRLSPNIWMVGDSIFPGQSAAAVALGGMRAAQHVLREAGGQIETPDLVDAVRSLRADSAAD